MKKRNAALAAFYASLITLTVVLVVSGEIWAWWLIVGVFVGLGLNEIFKGIHSELNPAPTGASYGESNMRALGYLFGWIANPMSIFWPAALAVVLVIPASQTWEMPFFGGTVYAFVHDLLPIVFGVWAVSNLLSGRWAPESMRRTDLMTSRFAFWAVVAIAAWIALSGSYATLSRELTMWLLIALAGVIVDYFGAKGEDFRSSMLRGDNARLVEENARLRGELANATARLTTLQPIGTAPATGNIGSQMFPEVIMAMRTTGLSEVGPFNAKFRSTPDGIAIDVPDDEIAAFVAKNKPQRPPMAP